MIKKIYIIGKSFKYYVVIFYNKLYDEKNFMENEDVSVKYLDCMMPPLSTKLNLLTWLAFRRKLAQRADDSSELIYFSVNISIQTVIFINSFSYITSFTFFYQNFYHLLFTQVN